MTRHSNRCLRWATTFMFPFFLNSCADFNAALRGDPPVIVDPGRKQCTMETQSACCPSDSGEFKVETLGSRSCGFVFRDGCFGPFTIISDESQPSRDGSGPKSLLCKRGKEPELGPRPIPNPNPSPRPEVWFAPNVGSKDLLDLYRKPAAWEKSRKSIHVIKHYTANLMGPATCANCGGNFSDAMIVVGAYHMIASWGIELAAEVGVLKPENKICSIADNSQRFVFMDALTKKAAVNGGRLSRISVDESMYAGIREDVAIPCKITLQQAAKEFINYAGVVIEPYPGSLQATTANSIKTYLSLVTQAGIKLDHFHLDIDNDALKPGWQQDVGAILEHARKLRIHTGIIFMAPVASGNKDFTLRLQENVQRYKEFVPLLDHVIFQSWALSLPLSANNSQVFPDNLPESGPSLTSGLMQGLEFLQPIFQRP